MSKNIQNVPKIRFPGFTGAWEQCKFVELVDRVSDISTNKSLPRVEYEDVISGQGVLNNNFHLKDINKKGNKFRKNDILFGYLRPYLDNRLLASFNGIAVGDWWVLRSEEDNKDFIYSLIQTEKFQSVANISTGTKMPRANWETVSRVNYFTPTSMEEQKKIGTFFSNLDNLITLHQRKLNNVKDLKTGLLQKMFPKKDEVFPEIRFPEFTYAWEQRKLGEVVQITMGQSPDSKNYTDNPNDHILVQGNGDMKNGRVLPRVWTTQITKQAEKGDLILSVRAPVGDIGKTDYDVVLGRGVAAIKGNEFVFQSLGRMKQNGYWVKLSTGSTFESINSSDIKDAHIKFPSKQEQDKVGLFFKNLDNLITLHQRKLENLQKLKKSLLQQMFI